MRVYCVQCRQLFIKGEEAYQDTQTGDVYCDGCHCLNWRSVIVNPGKRSQAAMTAACKAVTLETP